TTLGGPSSFGGLSTLNSVEGFVLSSVMTPTLVCEISSLTGLPESDARSGVFVLLALGLLQLEGEEAQVANKTQLTSEAPIVSDMLFGSEIPVASETLIASET